MKALTRVSIQLLFFTVTLLFHPLGFPAQAEEQAPRASMQGFLPTKKAVPESARDRKVPDAQEEAATKKREGEKENGSEKTTARNVMLMMLGISQSAHRR